MKKDLSVENLLWVEKYRPKTLDEMILDDNLRKIFENFVKDKTIPNILLLGPPGGGKTTLSRILTSQIVNSEDLLILNGSKQTGVDVIRYNVEEFLQSISFSDSGLKIVYIDEFDFMSSNAQGALRYIMENCPTGRFIFTANYGHKIIDALHSRVQTFRLASLSTENITKFCNEVLQKEKIKYKEEDLQTIIYNHKPDIRKIISILQSLTIENELVLDNGSIGEDLKLIELEVETIVVEIIIALMNNDNTTLVSSLNKLINILSKKEIENYELLYERLFFNEKFPYWIKIKINEYTINQNSTIVPQMNFMAMIYDIIKFYRDLNKVKNLNV